MTAKALEEEQLLTRLAQYWHSMRSGNPGFDWDQGRLAHATMSVYSRLQSSPGWKPGASDREVLGAWLTATGNGGWAPAQFETWCEGLWRKKRKTAKELLHSGAEDPLNPKY